MSQSQPELPAPYALAMILCDAVHTDPSTRKKTILGIFSALAAPGFPVQHPAMSIYVAMTDHEGPARVRLRVTDVDEENIIAQFEGDFNFPDRRAVMEVIAGLEGLVFPLPGEYRVQLHVNGTPLLERRLVVVPTNQ